MLRSFVKSICVAEHRQPVIHVGRAHATSYTDNPNKHKNQLYRQPRHRQPVIQAAQAQATSYTGSASTGNQLYTQRNHRERKHRQPVVQAAQAQATSYTSSASTGN